MKNLRFYIGEVKDAVQSGYERLKAWYYEMNIDIAYWWRTHAHTFWHTVIKFKWITVVLFVILGILSIAYMIR